MTLRLRARFNVHYWHRFNIDNIAPRASLLCLRPMYSQHFGLTQDPFSIAPDPRYLFMSERHREALAHLLYGVTGSGQRQASGGFVLLTGDIGTGKTTICRCFLQQIPAGCHVAYIFNPKLTVNELLQSICQEFHIALSGSANRNPSVKDYIDALNTFLLQSHASGQSCVLIIDEAQNLSAEVLEQLRLLTNLETDERKLLQIVLIGQPELRSMLERPELEQLAQRVIARFHLDALDADESMQYIAHRLAVAGHHGSLPFDAGALRRVLQLAHGVPRRINLLCGRALLGAWAHGQQRVDAKVVEQAGAEVFGTGSSNARATRRTPIAYWLTALVLLLLASAVGVSVWRTPAGIKAGTATATAINANPVPVKVLAAEVAPTPLRVEDIGQLWSQLPTDINVAWRVLAQRSMPVLRLIDGDAAPCQSAAAQQVLCYRAEKLDLPLLRQLRRDSILTLRDGSAATRFAVLVAMDEQTATLQVGSSRHRVGWLALARFWHGEFATLWRPPPGYRANLHVGDSAEVIDYLVQQLQRLDGMASNPQQPQLFDAGLRERLRAFQRSQGLRSDGLPGPMTFMQLERASADGKPRI